MHLVFYLQMDSEGEEQTLQTCNSITGKNDFPKPANPPSQYTLTRARTCARMHVPLTFMG